MSAVGLLAIAVVTPTIAQPLPLEWTQTPTGQTAALHWGIAHYDGRHWTRLDLPGDDSRMIVESLAVGGRNDIWAAGHWQDPTLIRRYRPTPTPPSPR